MTSKRNIFLAVGVIAVVGVLLVGALLSGTLSRGSSQARPACDSLPTFSQTQIAISQHRSLVQKVEAVGSDVHVTATRPCAPADRGIVTVRYASDGEKQRITKILDADTGFGAPVEVKQT